MLFKNLLSSAALLLSVTQGALGSLGLPRDPKHQHTKRTYFPKKATGLKELKTPAGITIRYKEPGDVCESTEGVKSYSGFIDLASNVHVFFYFFESRSDPANDPITLWLNGGPGSDSMIGLFEELGPCRINPDLYEAQRTSVINPYSWNNVSNMLFLSQPVGTGFSYQEIAKGTYNNITDGFMNSSQAPPTGTYPILDPVDVGTIDTTDLAAMAAWHVIQAFVSGMGKLDSNLKKVRDFNLWTESYGGHYGPAFYNYFYEQNEKIGSGKMDGYKLNFATLGIGNGIIDETIQAPHYPEFAMNNTYGIKAYNDTVYNYAKFALNMPNGCLNQIQLCELAAAEYKNGFVSEAHGNEITHAAASNPSVDTLCSEAQDMCRDNVEGVYYTFSGRGVYDIRHPYNDPTPPEYFIEYLNKAEVQEALGVSTNYTEANTDIYWQFQSTGDFVYPNCTQTIRWRDGWHEANYRPPVSTSVLADLENILASGVRVSLFYGDADYICNWFGGQAISLALKYSHSKEFAAAGYAPFTWGGVEYGEVREYGNFSFTRIYESGHEVPYYQPQGAFALFNRTINYLNIADGTEKVTGTLGSNGPSSATHTASAPTLPAKQSGAAYDKWSKSIVKSYSVLDNEPPPSATPTSSK